MVTGSQLREIALRHSRIIAGMGYAEKFDFEAIAAELETAHNAELADKNRTIERVRETVRAEMMRTLSDKLSMEEIATAAYAVEAALEGKQ